MDRNSRKMRKMLRCDTGRVVLIFTLAGMTSGSANVAYAQPTITNLGVLDGGDRSLGYGISADGTTVVGWSRSLSFAGFHAFRWTRTGGMQDLGVLPGGTNSQSFAYAISGDGSTVTGYASSSTLIRAFRWSSVTGMQDLGLLPNGNVAYGFAINNDGSAIAGRANTTNSANVGFLWTTNGGIQSLAQPPGSIEGRAFAISALGNVVAGTYRPCCTNERAVRWVNGGLEVLDGQSPNTNAYFGKSISTDGSIVAGYFSIIGVGTRLFRWTSTGGMQELGALVLPSSPSTWAYPYIAISGDGTAISGSQGASERAFLWTSGLGKVDLNTYLPTVGIDLTGWLLSNATALSYDGSAIAGYGAFNNEQRAWVVTGLPVCNPAILTNPQSASVCPNGGAAYSVTAVGPTPLTYQWQIETEPGVWTAVGNDPLPLPCGGGAFAAVSPHNSPNVNIYVQPCAGVTSYQLRCHVISPCGSADSNQARLDIVTKADMNCDCTLNGLDVAPFVRAVVDPGGYGTTFPGCDILYGDINGDLMVDIGDVLSFENCILTGCH